jgi:phosphoribosyl 1,2-cyclic phosphate phosphodiesterase
MELTILGSGGCAVIPKPLCGCPVCKEARRKGAPYKRTGPSAFIHDENLLIDTPSEIASQLNRSQIGRVDYLLFTHLDPDHVEGSRVVEHIALDFRTWRAYPEKRIHLILPEKLNDRLRDIRSVYGPLIDYYEEQGFVQRTLFQDTIEIGEMKTTAIAIDRGSQWSYVYVFESDGRKMVYAPCDIKPFPEDWSEVFRPDLLVIQPGIFEDGLRHGFVYQEDHISRTTLYTFEETLALARRIEADQILFIHLEEYWNRSHDDYVALEQGFDNVRFAYDGMHVNV